MNRKADGYFTVEAAMILPIVIGVIMMTMYLWYFQYDRCRLDQDTGRIVVKAVEARPLSADERVEYVAELAAETDEDSYLAWTPGAVYSQQKGYRLTVRQEGELQFPLPEWDIRDGKKPWAARSEYQNYCISPVSLVRSYQKIREVMRTAAAD